MICICVDQCGPMPLIVELATWEQLQVLAHREAWQDRRPGSSRIRPAAADADAAQARQPGQQASHVLACLHILGAPGLHVGRCLHHAP